MTCAAPGKRWARRRAAELVLDRIEIIEGLGGAVANDSDFIGTRFAGWGLVLIEGEPVWVYKRSQRPHDGIRIESADKPTRGKHTHTLDIAYSGKQGEAGNGGYAVAIEGNKVAKTNINRRVPYLYSID